VSFYPYKPSSAPITRTNCFLFRSSSLPYALSVNPDETSRTQVNNVRRRRLWDDFLCAFPFFCGWLPEFFIIAPMPRGVLKSQNVQKNKIALLTVAHLCVIFGA
jgi:hypothetical protein